MGGIANIISTTLFEQQQNKKSFQTKLNNLMTKQKLENKSAMNLLEKTLAEKKAKIGSMGLADSTSANAAKNRYKYDAMYELAQNNSSYENQKNNLENDFRKKRYQIMKSGFENFNN